MVRLPLKISRSAAGISDRLTRRLGPSAVLWGALPTRRVPRVLAVTAVLLVAVSAGDWTDAGEPAGTSPATVISVMPQGPLGRALPSGFVGLSFEYSAVPAYAGEGATVDPVLVQLIRNLAPGQAPVLRIGGDSTDQTWLPVRGVPRPGVVDYALTRSWFRATGRLARALGARLILGINLAIERPLLAAAEARALIAGIGRGSIAALEIGNEPDIYLHFPAYRGAHGRVEHVRGRGYDFAVFLRQFTAVRQALPRVAIAGPALGGVEWAAHLARFISGQPGLRVVTVHLYPLFGLAPPGSPDYPTVAHLLGAASSTGLADRAAPYILPVHARGLGFRVDELNSVTSGGRRGISNTFASALWVLDTLFAFDQAGVDGVNIHTFPGARYAPFAVSRSGGRWSASVRPEYYGMLMFGRAAPPGSRLLPVGPLPPGPVKLWATLARDHTIRVTLINEGSLPRQLRLAPPPGASGAATVEQMVAPSLMATGGVTIGGQTFGPRTNTGLLAGPPPAATLPAGPGADPITLPPASATLLTWTRP